MTKAARTLGSVLFAHHILFAKSTHARIVNTETLHTLWRKPMTTVLLVERDGGYWQPLLSFLEQKGLTVQTTICGQNAFELLTACPESFDLVIAGLDLPDVEPDDEHPIHHMFNLTKVRHWGGPILSKRLRLFGLNIPIIIWSRHGETECKLQAYGNGADDYVQKAHSFEELFSHIEAVLKRVQEETTPVAAE